MKRDTRLKSGWLFSKARPELVVLFCSDREGTWIHCRLFLITFSKFVQRTLWKKSSLIKIKLTKRQAYGEVFIPFYYSDKTLPLLNRIINAINLKEVGKRKVGQNHWKDVFFFCCLQESHVYRYNKRLWIIEFLN